MSVLGLILARGGSTRLPQKNILPLAGKPLIAHTIDAALASQIDRVVVSTDSEEIADVAKQYGADVPFVRPDHLATDDAASIDVTLHALQWLEEQEQYIPDIVILLQPTSPLRRAEDIDACITLAKEHDADAVMSVSAMDIGPEWAQTIGADGRLQRINLPPSSGQKWYQPNGALYLSRRSFLTEHKTWHADDAYAYVMPPERSIDIDTEWEFAIAESLLLRQ